MSTSSPSSEADYRQYPPLHAAGLVRRLALFLLFSFFILHASPAQAVPLLPNGNYTCNFGYVIGHVTPGDFNGDGLLDFSIKSNDPTSNLTIEARSNACQRLGGTFDIGVPATASDGSSNHFQIALLSWDFDGDGKWELYFQYLKQGQVRHQVIELDNNGNWVTVAGGDNAYFPHDPFNDYNNNGVHCAVLYKGGSPKIACVMTYGSRDHAYVYDPSNLNQLCSYYRAPSMEHDMIRTADIDNNGSDDEILAGRVVLNSDCSVRKDFGGDNSDQTMLGYYGTDPSQLMLVIGDNSYSGLITGYNFATGQKWEHRMKDYFPNWAHFHTGYVANLDSGVPGAEILAEDRNTSAWALIRAQDGVILDKDAAGPPRVSNPYCKPVSWYGGNSYTCRSENNKGLS